MDTGATGEKLGFFSLDAQAHLLDRCGVFAFQATQLHFLLGQIAAPDLQQTHCRVIEFTHTCRNCPVQDALALYHHAFRQNLLQHIQLAGVQQRSVTPDLRYQALLC